MARPRGLGQTRAWFETARLIAGSSGPHKPPQSGNFPELERRLSNLRNNAPPVVGNRRDGGEEPLVGRH